MSAALTREELAAEVEALRADRARLLDERHEEQFVGERQATELGLEENQARSDKRQATADQHQMAGLAVERLRVETAKELELIRRERADGLAAQVRFEAEKVRHDSERGLEVNRRLSDARSAEGESEARTLASKLAREVSQDAIALAEDRGRKDATLVLWQQGMEDHNRQQNGALQEIRADLKVLREKVSDIVNGLATKRAQDVVLAEEVKRQAEVAAKTQVSTQEFRRWAIGIVVAIGLAFAAARGFKF